MSNAQYPSYLLLGVTCHCHYDRQYYLYQMNNDDDDHHRSGGGNKIKGLRQGPVDF